MAAELHELIDIDEDRLLIARIDEEALPATPEARPSAGMNGRAVIL